VRLFRWITALFPAAPRGWKVQDTALLSLHVCALCSRQAGYADVLNVDRQHFDEQHKEVECGPIGAPTENSTWLA
jgi:hypothetical protein